MYYGRSTVFQASCEALGTKLFHLTLFPLSTSHPQTMALNNSSYLPFSWISGLTGFSWVALRVLSTVSDKVRWSHLKGFSSTHLVVIVGHHQASTEADRGHAHMWPLHVLGFPTACMVSGFQEHMTEKWERERERKVYCFLWPSPGSQAAPLLPHLFH